MDIMDTIVWIDSKLALTLHKMQIARFGGASGVRDKNLLESALSRPIHFLQFNENDQLSKIEMIGILAAKYAYGIIKNHPFIDGNKRTALIVLHVFLRINKFKLNATEEEQYAIIINLASGLVKDNDFTSWVLEKTTEFL